MEWKCPCGCGQTPKPPSRPDRYPDGLVFIPGHQTDRIADRTEKRCSDCRQTKPILEFHRSRNKPDGHTNICKLCVSARHTKPDARHRYRCSRHGLSLEDYSNLFEQQAGKCALCTVRPVAHIDHDRETGKVRGLLCQPCNTGLGKLGDTPVAIQRALDYVMGKDKRPQRAGKG